MSPARAGLLVGLLALLVVVYYGLEWRAGQVEKRETAARKVLDVQPDAVTAIKVERPGEPAIRIVREAGRFRVVEPKPVRTDDVAAFRIVQSLAGATRDRVLDGVDPQAPEYGLATPSLVVTLDTPGGPKALAFGATAPVGNGVYARRPGQAEVLVVPVHVRADAGPSLFELRDKKVVDVSRDAVRRLEVRPGKGTSSPSLLLTKEGADWKVEGSPAGREVDQYKARRVVDTATEMQMSAILAEDPGAAKPRALTSPARTLVIGLEGGATRTVTIGEPQGADQTAVQVGGDPAVYLVATPTLEALGQKPGDLLAPPPTPTPAAQASPAATK